MRIEESNSFRKLCTELIDASLKSANAIKSHALELWHSNKLSTEEAFALWITMFSEFIFFYLNLSDRLAFSILNELKRKALMSAVYTTMEHAVVDVMYKGNDQRKARLRKYFLERYLEASKLYSISKEILSQKEPLTGSGMVTILAREIADINGSSMNPEI